jgi:thiol-disulfide isomerase/thioredoxin
MRSHPFHLALTILYFLAFVLFVGLNHRLMAKDDLPWEKDFETAKEKAIEQNKPLFVMMTATWCGPCKKLESETLTNRKIQDALNDFIWVQAFEDKNVESKYQCNGYPTLVFVDATKDSVFSRSVGYQPVNTFLRTAIQARKSGNLPLSTELEELESKIFVPNQQTIDELIVANNAKGLKQYLLPASDDILRPSNFALLKLNLPEGVNYKDVRVKSGYWDIDTPASGLICIRMPVAQPKNEIRVIAPDCQALDFNILFKKDEAVATKVIDVLQLTPKTSARLAGEITFPNGKPAAGAIVRIADAGWVKADQKGRYKFAKLPVGEFDIRVECPGGELQDRIKLVSGKPMKQDIVIQPAKTIGIRWAIQTEENNPDFSSEGVRNGEAYFSSQNARFSLEKGWSTIVSSDFMIKDDMKGLEKILTTEQQQAILDQPDPRFFFWLFDASGHGNGLHRESQSFDQVVAVNNGDPFDPRKYFQFLRGEPLRVGDVYTVLCCKKKMYAKIEIIDLSSPSSR